MRSLLFGLTLAVSAGLVAHAPAADPVKVEGSLQMVPADAAFYTSTLRIGEQIDKFMASKAYAKLRSLPAAKFAAEQLKQEAAKPDHPLNQVVKFFEAPPNKELADVLIDLGRHEVFMYGGQDTIKFVSTAAAAFGAAQFAPAMAMINPANRNKNPQGIQLAAMLEVLKEHPEDILLPDLVLGFRSTKRAALQNQFNRLEPLAKMALQQAPPLIQNRLKRQKDGNADLLSFSVDGSMVPWDRIPFDDIDIKMDDYKDVFDRLKKLTLTLTIAVKGDYLLVCLSSDSGPVAKFGQSPALATRPEFAPLAKYADRKVVSLDYSSLKLAEAVATSAKDVQDMLQSVNEMLKDVPLSDGLKKRIADDVVVLGKEVSGHLPKPAATMGFSFLNDRGVEGFDHVYNESPGPSKALTILDNMGGSPLMAYANRGEDATPGYKYLVKWIRKFYDHAEAAVKEKVEDGQYEQFNEVMKKVIPFLKRFDEITGSQLLPALADGQSAIVVDGKWTSKAWFPELDQKGLELPMLELGLCISVSDSDLLVKAFKGYRSLVNDIFVEIRNLGAPDFEWPAPKTQNTGDATAFFWPFPDEGQDKSIIPNIAVSKSLLTFCLSLKHAERLHSKTNLAGELKQFAGDRPMASAGYVDFAGTVGTIRPWVEKLALPEILNQMPDRDAPPGLGKADIPPQVAIVLDVLQCLKGFRSVTYRDGNATVTRYETRVEDLK